MNEEKRDIKERDATELNTPLSREPVTMAIVCNALPHQLQKVIDFLEENKVRIIYRRCTYGSLYIVDKKEE